MTDTEPPQVPESQRLNSLSPSSDSDSDSDSAGRSSIQWLATAREKRSTAGNRMKAMLANEEPDSDLELLFAEDDDDQGFTDVGEDASDVHMDSSSSSDEDEGADGKGGELEGEKELEQQAREKRTAQRKKRKGQDAIPARFRKKVRIDPTTTTTTTTASSASTTPRPVNPPPPPRPKKKSERASWLPSVADQPTRASLRHTTRLSKEQLHAQMEEREARRLRQMAQMQKKAERLEATKKPPLTQEERLREAELVERRNAKSLNRWEVAEKQREEERRAKLAALNQRTLKGPVITFWSGTREWTDGGAARYVVLEEKPKRKPREKKDKTGKDKDKEKTGGTPHSTEVKDIPQTQAIMGQDAKTEPVTSPLLMAPPAQPVQDSEDQKVKAEEEISNESTTPAQPVQAISQAQAPDSPRSGSLAAPTLPPPRPPPSGLAAPAPPPQSDCSDSRPTTSKPSGVLAAPVLAPPAGVEPSPNEDTASSRHSPTGSVLAAPSPQLPPFQAQPQAQSQPLQSAPTESQPQATAVPKDIEQLRGNFTVTAPSSNTPSEAPPQAEDNTYTRNAIVYQNFDENLVKDKAIQTQILFGRKMNKLSKPPPIPMCVITNHPAKYRDPVTGLPFYNSYAYRQIQRLCKGEYRWSKILGAWVGAGQFAAKGVPDRFLNPEAPRPASKTPKVEDNVDKAVNQSSDKAGAGTGDVKKQSPDSAAGSAMGAASPIPTPPPPPHDTPTTNVAATPATTDPAAATPKDTAASASAAVMPTDDPIPTGNDKIKTETAPSQAQTPVET